ncbi:MAG: GAF and ANTAR domain-containing protein [Ilumatobacteraceae bacterium]
MSAPGNLPPEPSIAALSSTVFARYRSLDEALDHVADVGRRSLGHCVAASITVIERGQATTVGSTGGIADALDTAQYAAGSGPCLTAAREDRVIVVEDIEHDRRWARFAEAGVAAGVRSSLSVPMDVFGDDVVAGFNAYADVPSGFDDDERRVGEQFARHAATIVSNARAYWAAAELTRNLAAALETRGVIEQAKGVLVATLRITPDEAFDELRRRSQRENRKLNDVAGDIVQAAARH